MYSFMEHITDNMLKPQMGDPREPTLWPSEGMVTVKENGETIAYGKCRREVFFRYLTSKYDYKDLDPGYNNLVGLLKKEAKAPDRYMLWIWRMGEIFEDYIIALAKEAGTFIATQVPLYVKSHKISGKIDLIIINPETGKLSIVECKSIYGFNSQTVLGKPAERAKGRMGTPKESNLLQIATYQYHVKYGNREDGFLSASKIEEARLVYGSRDTGVYGEFLVDVEEDGTIKYKFNGPIVSDKWIISPYNILNAYQQYAFILDSIETKTIPERDYQLIYDQKKIDDLAKNKKLNKTDQEKYDKIEARKLENIERVSDGLKPKVELKALELGDWQCDRCKYANICYNRETNETKNLSNLID